MGHEDTTWHCEDCGKTMEEGPCTYVAPKVIAERKVIEAAKALDIDDLIYTARMERDFTTEECRAIRDFDNAVTALLAAEKVE
jgi:hypothetical protein